MTSDLKVLKIGALLALNNTAPLWAKDWLNLIAKQYNDAGGWKIGNDTYRVEMVIYDTQANLTTAKDELTKLVLQDGVKFIVAGTTSVGVDITVTEPNKVIVYAMDSGNDSADPSVQYYYTWGYFFGGAFPFIIASDMGKSGAKSYVSVKPDNGLAHFMNDQINGAWALGAPNTKYLDTVWVDPSTVDYGPIATKVMNLNPDVVDMLFIGDLPNGIVQMYKALADVGYHGTILPGAMNPEDLNNLVTMVGKDFIEGGEVNASDVSLQTDPKMLSLINAYADVYGVDGRDRALGLRSILGFFPIEAAINATQSVDTDVIKNYLDNNPPPIRNPFGFTQLFARPDCKNLRTISGTQSLPMWVIKDGKLTVSTTSFITVEDQYLFSIKVFNLGDLYKTYWEEYGYPSFPSEEKGKNILNYASFGITGHD